MSFLFTLLLSTPQLQAAPCCGGASLIPTLITGDDHAQMSVLVSQIATVGNANPFGKVRLSPLDQVDQQFRVLTDGAIKLSDWVQLSASLSWINRWAQHGVSQMAQSSGLADVFAGMAYEFLPEYQYSPWKPKGFVYTQFFYPLGPSIHEATLAYQVDARTRGFPGLTLGVSLVKILGHWDFLLNTQVSKLFERTFPETPNSPSQSFNPGYSWVGLFGVGYSPAQTRLRVGISLSPLYDTKIIVNAQHELPSKLIWNTVFQLGFSLTEELMLSFLYLDQTLLGVPHNASLTRACSLFIQKRWSL